MIGDIFSFFTGYFNNSSTTLNTTSKINEAEGKWINASQPERENIVENLAKDQSITDSELIDFLTKQSAFIDFNFPNLDLILEQFRSLDFPGIGKTLMPLAKRQKVHCIFRTIFHMTRSKFLPSSVS